ncbi:armadillo-type protein [Mycena polygramma]|nr:armadillo-type protein [Mycena polygramma]
MQPLARQRSRSSILSWWSDSNPPGVTVNIHAVAKPLMRFMYHRQALDLIKNNKPGTLSSTLLEFYSAYLSCKYVSVATKGAVLGELETLSHYDGPCTVIVGDELVLRQVVELAIAADITKTLRIEACGILGNVVVSTTPTLSQRAELCRSLVSLLRDKDIEIAAVVSGAMSSAASTLKAAKALIDADALDYLSELLASPDRHVRAEGRKLITNLASHDLGRTYGPRLCGWLVSFLRVSEYHVVEAAAQALSILAKSLKGAKMVLDANALDYLAEILGSPNRYVWEWPWKLVMNLASHNLRTYGPRLCVWLVSFLRVAEHDVVEAATHALSLVAESLQGAKMVIEAKAANYLEQLLKSERAEIRTQTWVLMKQLASHEVTAPMIFPLIMGGHDFDLPDGLPADAIYTLMNIAKWSDGTRWHWEAVDREVLNGISQLLESQQPLVCRFACAVAGKIAAHGHPAASAILGMEVCVKLVSIMCNGPGTLTEAAIYALCRIYRLPHGVQDAVEAKIVEQLWTLLDPELPALPAGYCELVQILAYHSLTSPAIITLSSPLRIKFTSLLRGPDKSTRSSLKALLLSGDPEVQTWTWWLVLRLVDREAVENPSFVRGLIAQCPEPENPSNPSPGPATISSETAPSFNVGKNSEIRQHLIDLTKSSNAEVQRWTEGLQKRLAHDDPV